MSERGGAGARNRPLLAILLAVIGAGLVAWGFFGTVGTALGGQFGPLYPAIFAVGGVAVIAAIVLSIIGLRRGGSKAPWVAALVIAVLPVAALLAIAVASAIS